MFVTAPPLTIHDLRHGLTDSQALTFTIYGEARGEPIEGRIAIGCVIRNRVRERRKQWGDTISSVCFSHAQFSCWYTWGGVSNHEHLMTLVDVLLHGGPPAWSTRERDIYQECAWITEGLADLSYDGRVRPGIVLDRVAGATHYMTKTLWETDTVVWGRGQVPVAEVGEHVFFKGIR